jgi:DNA (cytosine-5)-methyltransferase 1
MLTVGDLFSGIGGFSLGLERAGMRTAWFAEVDPYASAVLKKHWPEVPNHGDVRSIRAGSVERVDVLCGGFPCQDISSAGAKAGIDGERSGLWGEYLRIVGEIRPRFLIVENVAALLGRGLDRVLGDLAALGHDAEWHCIPAAYVGAPIDREGRDRVWIVAYPGGGGRSGPWLSRRLARELVARPARSDCAVARVSGSAPYLRADQPGVCRMDHGVPARAHRIKCLGNTLSPDIAEIIGRAIVRAA